MGATSIGHDRVLLLVLGEFRLKVEKRIAAEQDFWESMADFKARG